MDTQKKIKESLIDKFFEDEGWRYNAAYGQLSKYYESENAYLFKASVNSKWEAYKFATNYNEVHY